MTHYCISDLHLSADAPHITELYLQFCETLREGDQLFILGDFFNYWVGDDAMTAFEKRIQTHLKSLCCKGISIHLLYGNRDFLMRKAFFQSTGIQFLKDESLIQYHHQPVLLMHGDTLCTDDKSYLRYRRFVRTRWIQQLFLSLPVAWRQGIAKKIRQNSQRNFDRNKVLVDVNQSAVEAVMRKHQVTLLIHGHTHQAGIHRFELDGKPVKRIVLGAWHETGSVLKLDNETTEQLLTFPFPQHQ